MLHHGLYEQVINNALTSELAEIPEARKAVAPIDKAEASKVLAQYLADVVQKGLDNVLDNGGDISAQIALANRIVGLIQNTTHEADFAALGIDKRAEQLLALLREADPRLCIVMQITIYKALWREKRYKGLKYSCERCNCKACIRIGLEMP